MKKPQQNLIIDATAFVLFLFLAVTGLVLRYSLPAGSEGAHLGPGEGRPVGLLWGLTRHEWGEAHFWIGVAVLAVLAVHLLFHWTWIAHMIKGRETTSSWRRLVVGAAALLLLIFLLISPFLTPTTQVSRQEFMQERLEDHEQQESDGRRSNSTRDLPR